MQGLFILHYPSYDPKPWHASLITLAYLAIAVLFNTFCAAGLPMLEAGLVFLHILGVFIFIPVWVLSPKREGGAPLVDFYNPGGWSSDGVATLVGAAPIITTLIGFDCSVHMGMLSSQPVAYFAYLFLLAEEAKDSSRNVPYTLLSGYGVNVLLGLFVLISV
jgi:Amino acid permease